MLQLIAGNMTIFWICAIVVFLIIEAITAGLATIWFAVGSLAALISALCGAQIWLQIVWFFVVSIVTLIFTRPLVKKYVNAKSQPTNADMVLGMECIVKEDVDNVAGTGAVAVAGKTWTARSTTGERIPAGALVTADRIEGVKLYVHEAGAESEDTAETAEE